MPDYNSEASKVWDALRPAIDSEIDQRTRGMVQRRKAKVTTAPSLVTNKIGVTEPYGSEMFIPFVSNLASAVVGDYVWIEFMYGANNSFASMFAEADTKDQTVAGNLTVNGNTTLNGVLDVTKRRATASLSGNSWYRVLKYTGINDNYDYLGDYGRIFDFNITRKYTNGNNEVHKIRLLNPYNVFKFVDENSCTNVHFIDKIRCTANSSTKEFFVDIHYNTSNTNPVTVDFVLHSNQITQSRCVSTGLTAVVDSPSGETILTTYTFAVNAYHKPVAREGASNGWSYVLYADNTIDATRTITDTLSNYTTVNGFYGYYIPSIVTPFYMEDTNYYIGTEWSIGTGFSVPAGILSKATNQFNAYALATASGSQSVKLTMHLKGTVAH